jgi:hypothetical protein
MRNLWSIYADRKVHRRCQVQGEAQVSFEKWDHITLEEVNSHTANHIRACYAELDAKDKRIQQLEAAIRNALDNLGVPGPGYPAPIAEARRGLLYGLMNNQCPPCDIGENTECVCPPNALTGEKP